MRDIFRKQAAKIVAASLVGIVSPAWGGAELITTPVPTVIVPFPDAAPGIVYRGRTLEASPRGGRGPEATPKVSPDLRRLYLQYHPSRGVLTLPPYSLSQLQSRYGIMSTDKEPAVGLAITLTPGTDPRAIGRTLAQAGATVYFLIGRTAYVSAPVRVLAKLEQNSSIAAITPTKAAAFPAPPASRGTLDINLPPLGRGAQALPLAFNHAGLTGKGVVVGIVDSGIAWKHADFRKPNGATRILALWDMTDNSWASSSGKIGSQPPAEWEGKPLGTLYTQAQINAALRGTGVVNSQDLVGHGTACAGTAAGNGRATGAGIPAGTYAGVAPAADLLIVRAGAGEGIMSVYYLGTRWIARKAKAMGEPCVISQSFGNQDSPHDGSTAEEAVMDEIAGTGKPGVVICAAAGNEGRESFHAGGRFGPKLYGQGDIQSSPVELFVTKETELDAYFSHADDWGLVIVGLDHFLVDANGHPDPMFIYHKDGQVSGKLKTPAVQPTDFGTYFDTIGVTSAHDGQEDRLSVPLPAGKYLVFGFGAGPTVLTGAFDLYLPFSGDASFGSGTEKRYMVATPGNAETVLTVGAYNVRNGWANAGGKQTTFNLLLGDLSDYSSPGFRRGGAIKPDLAAPATYMISPLAPGSEMSQDEDHQPDTAHITADGFHLAWAGTSAATPYVAGVVALMLQKKPTLDAVQVKRILTKSAAHDVFTGAVPNINWGYGKIAPAAALAATPAK